MDTELAALLRKWALANAIKYNGQANFGAVLGKLLAEKPDLKSELKTLTGEIKKIVETVSSIPVDDQRKELQETAPELLDVKHEKQEHVLKELQGAEPGKVVMRMAPAPSGVMHIGHTYVLGMTSEYVKKYNGKLILRLEDTNPENIDPIAYKQLEEDARWLTNNNIHNVVIQSDRLHTYYDVAEKLIQMGKAYVCTCNADVFRELVQRKKACACRDKPLAEQNLRWDKMFNGYEPGEAVVRVKTDINDPNPAMRDWPAMRINHHVHPRTGTKEKVWPLMNLAVAVDDHELGVTHTIRGKDHMDNEKRQKHIFDAFNWPMPKHFYVGRINFEGIDLSKTATKEAITQGKYTGWDDIRLPFLMALKRRGYQPLALVQWALDMGLGQNDKTVPIEEFYKHVDAHNRKLIEPIANRYFFVNEPVEVSITGMPAHTAELPLHPDHADRGTRTLNAGEKLYLAKDDVDQLTDGPVYRLMECGNFVKQGTNFHYHSKTVEEYREKGASRIMHWLPAVPDLAKVEVHLPDGTKKQGYGEPGLKQLKEGTLIQFERFGFCRLDKKHGDKLTFWFTHK